LIEENNTAYMVHVFTSTQKWALDLQESVKR